MKSNTKFRIALYMVVAAAIALVYTARILAEKEHKRALTDLFDTVCELTVYSRSEKALDECQLYLEKIDSELSARDSSSALSRMNDGENVVLSEDSLSLIEFGKSFTEENPDYFSVYLNPLAEAWDIKNNTGYIPDVDTAISLCRKKQSVDLGGCAKGFLTDRLVEILKKNGISSALINLGGNAYALGKKPTGENWKIGIQNPQKTDEIIGIVTAENLSVVTSGDYERFFELDGVRYHHVFDPKTGYPAQSGLRSVTIISENAAIADALSTAIFVAGEEKGEELLNQYNVRGILISDNTVYFSKSLENIFKQLDFSYKYKFIY